MIVKKVFVRMVPHVMIQSMVSGNINYWQYKVEQQFYVFRCECALGFTGDYCQTDINECLADPCQYNGTCLEVDNTYKCICQDGYEGKNCEININECADNPCAEGATCIDLVNAYRCQCLPGNFDLKYSANYSFIM